jgi:hypothetical protein
MRKQHYNMKQALQQVRFTWLKRQSDSQALALH